MWVHNVLYVKCLFYLSLQGDWLYNKYGLAMKIVWGVGILAAGQSSTMTVSLWHSQNSQLTGNCIYIYANSKI